MKEARKKTKQDCAILVATGKMNGINTTVAVSNFDFIGGSLGASETEAIIYAIDHCIKNKQPFVNVCASGGARMYESLIALSGMTKVTLAINELKSKLLEMQNEKEDLSLAIKKLEDGITELNKEGRNRLRSSFDEVNDNFKKIFTKLFDGGNAELKLIGSDDPLQSGLEIFASPPEKKMQSLSLLSGGEQALTSISLIFAVYLSNPSPLCILDEVDAALDDTNVGRFCDILKYLSDEQDISFLIVTHHRLTMAKMNKLLGVTMEEKGISKLLSVDLEKAVEIKEAS